ncbi:nuclear transport factor 2 family protein [Alkalihalophilus lindianensis]|uniref:Nuclear transport factor 2 family protein n=1 Tax=Alkalihalophilus lindianensis TaxID=1630542 RepID=A0ABU3XCL0_9BACI|nr:nuclear transport factor 2 family protein [Alkalihalophilus lindianensis]MDV2685624.1 nuclear transport factor 2 family protein [Alkalihalophilus lindianensis]
MNYEDTLKKYIEATNTHDFNNVKKVLHDQAIYWFTDKTCTNSREIQKYFENAWELIKEEVYTANDIRWISTDPNSATCIYSYHYKGYHNGKLVSGNGRATNIFIRTNYNEWKLIHEHLSSPS